MTQAEFAKEIGVTKDMLYTYEKGKAVPSNLTIERIAKIAGINSDILEKKALKESDLKLLYTTTISTKPQIPNQAINPDPREQRILELEETVKKLELDKERLYNLLENSLQKA